MLHRIPTTRLSSHSRLGISSRRILANATNAPHKGVTVGVRVDPSDFEGGKLPLNTHSPKEPFRGKILSIRRLGGRNKERDVSEIVIDTGGVRFVEGQVGSCG